MVWRGRTMGRKSVQLPRAVHIARVTLSKSTWDAFLWRQQVLHLIFFLTLANGKGMECVSTHAYTHTHMEESSTRLAPAHPLGSILLQWWGNLCQRKRLATATDCSEVKIEDWRLGRMEFNFVRNFVQIRCTSNTSIRILCWVNIVTDTRTWPRTTAKSIRDFVIASAVWPGQKGVRPCECKSEGQLSTLTRT